MSLYQRFVRDVLYPLHHWRSGEAAEVRYLRQFERTQFLAADDLRQMAFQRLRHLVDHAYRECPFYRRQFDAAGFLPSDLGSLDDLSAVPVLEKRHIQQHRDEMVSRGWPRSDLIPNQTGGSTGTPISYFLSHDRSCSRAAAAWRHNRWSGWDVGDKVAVIWGAPADAPDHTWKTRLRRLLLDRCIWLNTACITESKLKQFHAAMNRFRPKHILAYAKPLVLLARYLESRRLEPYRPQSIVTSAEVLEPSERVVIEDVFGCPVFNRYGCREVSVVASECAEHEGMHVMAEGLHVEVVHGERPAGAGELGQVLVTDLLNPAMPLIRYRIGDLAGYEAGSCRCGRGLPRLSRLAGRVTDFLVGSDGRLVSGVLIATAVVAHRPALGQVQLWQDAPGELLWRIAPGNGRAVPRADLQFIEEQSKRYLGSDTKIDYEFIDELTSSQSGKFLWCRSSAACDFLSRPEPGDHPVVCTS